MALGTSAAGGGSGQPTTWQGIVFASAEFEVVLSWNISNPAQPVGPSKVTSGHCNGACLAGDRLYAFSICGWIISLRLSKAPGGNLLSLIEPEFPLTGAMNGIAYDDLLYVR